MEELEKERKELEAMRKKHLAELKKEKDIEQKRLEDERHREEMREEQELREAKAKERK